MGATLQKAASVSPWTTINTGPKLPQIEVAGHEGVILSFGVLMVSIHIVLYWVLGMIGLLSLSTYIRVRNSAAYRQQSDQVAIREPGRRRLGLPQPITLTGPEDLAFALLSQAAYQRKPDATSLDKDKSLDADTILQQLGWTMWPDLGDSELQRRIDKVHLRVEVWSQDREKKVAVAFGGTVFTNTKDWKANLRWFIPHHQDEYTFVVKTFGKAFIAAYLKHAQQLGWQSSDHIHLFATGHSLGGGLAQEFAYSLPLDQRVPRIDKVYAFDPSPVTGFYSVKKYVREHNAQNLATHRIYERGEILAYVRSITNYLFPPSAASPTIRQLRYFLLPTHNPIAGHSIAEFAAQLYEQLQNLGSLSLPNLSRSSHAG